MHGPLASASFGNTLTSFLDAAGKFFSDLAAVRWGVLLLGLLFFAANLTLRSRAMFNTLRAAYPQERFQWRRIWGAYVAAVGFNSIVPARGGDVIKLFLIKTSIRNSSYPAVAASFAVEAIFDIVVGLVVLIFAFSQGVFPKPPDFSKLNAFDISYLASHFRLTIFLFTASIVLGFALFALLSRRVIEFWARVRQGLVILNDRPRYLREVAALQSLAWLCRATAFWFMLEAFRVGASVRNVLLVFGVQQVAGAVPFTPGGAGVQQALLVQVFANAGNADVIAAYSVGQQLAVAIFTAAIGLGAIVFIFRFRSFGEVIQAGRAAREADRKSPGNGGDQPATAGPRAPRAPV